MNKKLWDSWEKYVEKVMTLEKMVNIKSKELEIKKLKGEDIKKEKEKLDKMKDILRKDMVLIVNSL